MNRVKENTVAVASLISSVEEEEAVDLKVHKLKQSKLLFVSEEHGTMWGRRDRFWNQVNLGLNPSSIVD
jgi:hypothetical protein